MVFTTKKVLYLVDCGDFVKIGISRAVKNRFATLYSDLGEKFILNKTIIWALRDRDAEFLENAIKRKYINNIVENSVSKSECFSYDTKLAIIETVQMAINTLDIEHGIYNATDIFEFRLNNESLTIQYTPAIEKRIAERTIYPSTYQSVINNENMKMALDVAKSGLKLEFTP